MYALLSYEGLIESNWNLIQNPLTKVIYIQNLTDKGQC